MIENKPVSYEVSRIESITIDGVTYTSDDFDLEANFTFNRVEDTEEHKEVLCKIKTGEM